MFHFSQAIFKKLILVLTVSVLVIGAFGSAGATETRTTDSPVSERKRIETEASRIKEKVDEKKKEFKDFTQKELETVTHLDQIEQSLNQIRQQVAKSEKELSFLAARIETAETSLKKLAEEIDRNEQIASGRAVGLYKLNSLGRIHILAGADSMNDFFQRKNALEHVLEHDEQLLNRLRGQQAELQQQMDRLKEKKEVQARLEARHGEQMRELTRQKTRRETLLEQIRTRKSLAGAALFALKRSADKLDQQLRELQLRPPSDPAPERRPNAFTSLKGLLNMPVEGKITSFFGHYKNTEFDILNFQSGIRIAAERGNPIHSVGPGEVIYSSWFKGYGNMIIIDHGEHYYTLYAHAEELFKSKGEPVETGEVIATVGDTGSIPGPGLHFEVRHHGNPVDPLEWLKKG